MKFRVNSQYTGVRFPIIKNSHNTYSPLVFEGSNDVNRLLSPWEADITVYPNRDITINNSLASAFSHPLYGGSDWPSWLNGSDADDRVKVITAFNNSQGTPYYYSIRTNPDVNVPSDNWAQHYYDGYEYEYDLTGIHLGAYGGVFWNLNNYSAITTDTNKLRYNFGGVVSVQNTMFEPHYKSYNYTWGAPLYPPHPYFDDFNIPYDINKAITSISVTGTLQPFIYYIGVGIKGGNYVSGNNKTSGAMFLGSWDDELTATNFTYMMSAGVNSMVTGTTQTLYLSHVDGQGSISRTGIIRHFNMQDSYEYFVLDGHIDFSAATTALTNHNVSGVSNPIFTFGVNRTNLSNEYGAIWNNATAIATCNDGSTYTKTGRINLAPYGNTINWMENYLNIKSNFYIDDLKMGIKYMP